MGATIIYLQKATPEYEAQTTLMHEPENNPTMSLISDTRSPLSIVPEMESQQLLIQSTLILSDVVKQMATNGFSVSVDELRKRISLNTISKSGDMLAIAATAENPTEAMVLANTVADVYIAKMSEMKSANIDRAEDFLSDQMNFVNNNLREAEEALNTFREQEEIVAVSSKEDGSTGLLRKLGDLYAELSEAQSNKEFAQANLSTARQLLEEKKKDIKSISNNKLTSQIESLEALISNLQVELAKLQQQFTDDYPEVINLKNNIAIAQSELDSKFEEFKQHSGSIDPLSEWQSLMQESIKLEIQLKGLQQKEDILKARIAQFKVDHPQFISKGLELTRLERIARINEQTYILLLDKYEQIRLMKQMHTVSIKIIDRATAPKSPIKPNKRLTVTLGILLGLIIGIGAAFFLEYIDDSLKVEKDIEDCLGVPVVGIIPEIEIEKATLKAIEDKELRESNPHGNNSEETINESALVGRPSPQQRKTGSNRRQKERFNLIGRIITNLEPNSLATESYRALRTNIRFANVDEEVKIILISSPGPREGKTLTVANLAITMARMGIKTLLVDADLRHSSLHTIFQQEKEPGLSELLVSQNPFTSFEGEDTDAPSNSANQGLQALNDRDTSVARFGFVRTTEIENLYLLPGGEKPPNPAELLSSDRMQQLIKELKSEFEVILFDSPPIVPVTDATVLASKIADTVLLVIKSGEIKREVAQKAKEILARVNANIFGIVLNNIDYAKQYGSYYDYY
jgi:Mrp family chromosome partitioning ATPase/uncharacterized protein involved in exopolysaccharide biosynthesis